jgi:XTP/dITP diphosphohydrolase
MTIWFASGNAHKRDELAALLDVTGLSVKMPREAGLAFEVIENGASVYENALIQARALFSVVREPVIADDSGLCVDALDGRPGIFSARYGEKDGEKLGAARRNALLLAEIGDTPLRTARFVCSCVLFLGENRFFLSEETLEGEIISAPRGEGGFGYDPLLYLPEAGRTVAELSAPQKNRISHRAKAVRALLGALSALREESRNGAA